MSRHRYASRIQHLNNLLVELEATGGITSEIEEWVAPIVTQALTLGLLDKAKDELERQRNIYQEIKAHAPKKALAALIDKPPI